ncbi:MAG: NAD-dependent epimerase [Bacteroidia bacterium]|nr:NAD-dependent epimerase [Bacteroidia bacterium]
MKTTYTVKKILVTGVAGFIGMHVAQRLLERGDEVIGVDNLNDYYDVSLKQARVEQLDTYPGFRFLKMDICDREAMTRLFDEIKPQRVIHLAAQAGVRHSITNPYAYIDTNVNGFLNILEGCRHHQVEHLVFASSSSVYGGNTRLPFSEHDSVDHPVSLYAATKKTNELMAHTYSHVYGLPTTGLRFFTVYGPWVRPDMALFLFTKAIMEEKPIEVFNHGNMVRDFTYIDDIVAGVIKVTDKVSEPDPAFDADNPDPATSSAPYRIFNIGNHHRVALNVYIETLESALGRSAIKKYLPTQPGDVLATEADISELVEWIGFKPNTSIETGIGHFVKWYREYYKA